MFAHALFTAIAPELRTDSISLLGTGLVAGWETVADKPEHRTDSTSMLYAARQLEHVFDDVYEEDFPDLPGANGSLMPEDRSVNEGAKTWTYYMYSGTAIARWAADYSGGTLPRVSRQGAEVTRRCHPIENEYAYTTEDMRAAAFAGDQLDSALGTLARRGHDVQKHRSALWGRSELGVDGLLTLPNSTVLSATASFVSATVDQIVADVGALIESCDTLTNGLRKATRVLMSRRVMNLLIRRRLGTGDGTLSIMDYLRKTWADVEFMILEELDHRKAAEEAAADPAFPVDVDSSTGDVMVAYIHNQPKVLRLVEPMTFKQHPMQFVSLEFVVPCESKIGGIRCPEPLTITRLEGVHA